MTLEVYYGYVFEGLITFVLVIHAVFWTMCHLGGLLAFSVFLPYVLIDRLLGKRAGLVALVVLMIYFGLAVLGYLSRHLF